VRRHDEVRWWRARKAFGFSKKIARECIAGDILCLPFLFVQQPFTLLGEYAGEERVPVMPFVYWRISPHEYACGKQVVHHNAHPWGYIDLR
jgi:hypothetical protein